MKQSQNSKQHEHRFDQEAEEVVLLGKYRPEEGEMKYTSTSGKDIIKLRKCKCGKQYAYTLERLKA